jgi:hypothetical protein
VSHRGVWEHHKGKLYVVLGVADVVLGSPPPGRLILGVARHSETGDPWEVFAAESPDHMARLWAHPEVAPARGQEHPFVVYVPLYDTGGTQLAVRPLPMWSELVEKTIDETAYTPARTVHVPRFRFLRP